jgi:hypothetical protein
MQEFYSLLNHHEIILNESSLDESTLIGGHHLIQPASKPIS